MPGRIHLCHRRLDAGSHGTGPALVQGVAGQPLAPCRHDGWAVVNSPPPQAHCRSHGLSILLGHSVVPGGAWYADRLKGLVRLAHKLVVVVCCGVWVIVNVTCVVVNTIHLPQCHRCYTVLAGKEKQQVTFVVDSPYRMIWYYSTTRMTFDHAKFLSFCLNLAAKLELGTGPAKFKFGCQVFWSQYLFHKFPP